jgi:hypothetical protein
VSERHDMPAHSPGRRRASQGQGTITLSGAVAMEAGVMIGAGIFA